MPSGLFEYFINLKVDSIYNSIYNIIYRIHKVHKEFIIMTAVLVNLPESIKNESMKVAKYLGLSRTEFIKRAIVHELDNFKKQTEEQKLVKAFNAMKNSKTYLAETIEIMDEFSFNETEEKEWWSKK